MQHMESGDGMASKSLHKASAAGRAGSFNRELIKVGDWYWVNGDQGEWIGCLMKIGSNFVEIHTPHNPKGGHGSIRIHLDNFDEYLRYEPNPSAVIGAKVVQHQSAISGHLKEIRGIMARLGMTNYLMLDNKQNETGTALATLSQQPDVSAYKKSLIKAKDKELPKLFKAIEEDSKELGRWMAAESMPMIAAKEGLEQSIEDIEDRIFNVSLYAGLTEKVKQITDGDPAPADAKLHVMQRRLYMDEECLMDYKAGGIDFNSIGEFDKWLSKRHNRDRVLPFPRCLVAMRVRREAKEREWDGSLLDAFINIRLKEADKITFLYIRNGDCLYRLNCDLEFDEMIFPDSSIFDPSEPMMVNMFGSRPDKFMSVRQYEAEIREYEERKAVFDKFEKEHPKNKHNPHWNYERGFRQRDWEKFDTENLYYDECVEALHAIIKKYNRVALIIQGLFDRSEILHPHPPVKTWTPEGFESAIELVFDSSNVLTYWEPPDFEEYRAKCNASLGKDSIVVGQEDYWLRVEAKKENARRDRDWRDRSGHRVTRFWPRGNNGPGHVSRIEIWAPRARRATFKWTRKGRWSPYGGEKKYVSSISVPASQLFNISAYTKGDYRLFFQDPRSREKYIKWAPFLLAAEDYLGGEIQLGKPSDDRD
jgi:hypothetical protein